MELIMRTEYLINHLHELKDHFENSEAPENIRDKAFFARVKEKTTPIFESLEKWEEEALRVVKERKVNIHPQQINSTRENMELVLMHSYYKDLRRRRYMEYYKSILYIFEQLVDELK
ncbi:DUF1798 family protein [Oceanobacillus halophilus]|uniref:DUF1798 family protein n=1 Tax=Oceanobacillus halophilus TaxID=930130 RepID=A0A495ADE1_9BACI|nr:DUF1798 family protein [Oceanobacillus halophilus]RKQ37630.1 DUF1798 family protein [Oceanobacillus halophilus]